MLGQNEQFRVHALELFAETLPELVVELLAVPQVGGDVEAPAVYGVGRHGPVARNADDLVA